MENEEQSTEEAVETSWVDSIEDAELKESLGKFESRDKLLDAIGYEAPKESSDWRDSISDDLKKTAERFTSPDDAIRSIVAFQKREGQVRVPGKDASEEELAAYHKAVGVPESPSDYEFPEIPEGYEMTDEVQASRELWGKRFHELGVSKDVALQLSNLVNEDAIQIEAAQAEADKAFVQSQMDALKSEWKGDEYDKNARIANNAFANILDRAGIDIDHFTQKRVDGKTFLNDDADMLKIFALLGREMSEGTLGPAMSESERESADEELRGLRSKISEAQSSGDTKRANLLYQREQALIAKISGDKPIVGAGRAA